MHKNQPKILVVDDSELNLKKLCSLLGEKDFEITTITDGRTAVKAAAKGDFDLMLLDIIMPGMDGFEVCSRLKKNARTSGMPVIFLTGQTSPESIRKGFEAGAVDYVAKPFNRAELLARVQNQIDLKRSREEAHQARLAAEEALRYKSVFLANMSHEIRTPINGIIGMSEFLDSTTLDSKQAEYVHIIQSSAQSLLNLINDILDFSKLEAGKIELENLDFDLHDHVKVTLKSVNFMADEKGLKLRLIIEKDVPHSVNGDPTRLRQVLLNLISNALKFTEKGSITIHVSAENDSGDGHHIKFEVIDTGIGISQEGINRLFKSFSQVDASTTRNFGGTGLGLVISKSLSEMMGGKIGVQSTLGKGSTFWFTIRVQSSNHDLVAKPGRAGMSPDTVEMPALKILLAEDNFVNQKVAGIHLEKLGHTVEIATNGLAAFEAYKNNDYHLIFMDIQMPEADGFESTRLIRRWEAMQKNKQRIPIIAMTANALKGDKEKCIGAGMDDYISKPFTAKALKETLRKYTNHI